ncbi:ADP-ribosylation/Crystallin J1 [Desulfovibrio sp. X2]|uniref:ADP-ribosylglycohydrolase family protein n=1 Tax=Desulfovibrio sp. X2 TaxID=941449 RepID=UPI000358B7AA|nr:ADP-ribosylglycohydrolase family protein [Desulfovibrio sp. X2]EPR43997.1 ADP-ribosylation/Crystallin J1 [Desulfovibrio sp. X2]
MDTTRRAAVLAAFVGDCLALGPHWIYDQARIAREFPGLSGPVAPLADSYHKGKGRGDFTHYGDQMLVLLESAAAKGGFDAADFAQRWQALFADGYAGYVDGATRRTLENLKAGWPAEEAGSTSQDLSGASRFAPLLGFVTDPEALAGAARQQAALTHKSPQVVDAAAFLARVASRVLGGQAVRPAVEEAAKQAEVPDIGRLAEAGLASAGEDSLAVIERFGQNCEFQSAFPSVVHLLARYADDPAAGLLQSTLAGGDSAARNIAVGCVLGAAHGEGAVPAGWLEAMKAAPRIQELLS